MIGRVVEIAQDGRHLSILRGFMIIEEDRQEVARIPLDDIGMVVANAHGLTYSNNLLIKLAERGASMVFCGANHHPVAWLWPMEGHHTQTARMRAQIEAPRPLCKRLWQIIVRAKVAQQRAVLESLGEQGGAFDLLARRVRSGDPDNIEAQAARRYWPLLMGSDFRRDRNLPGVNALLNYGYTVLRAAVARAVVATGLHPTIGIHHANRGDSFCLVDDLMEPFRPLIDLATMRLTAAGHVDLKPEVKRTLVNVLFTDMRTVYGTTPIATCLERLAGSLAAAFESKRAELDLPLAPLPLDLTGIGRI